MIIRLILQHTARLCGHVKRISWSIGLLVDAFGAFLTDSTCIRFLPKIIKKVNLYRFGTETKMLQSGVESALHTQPNCADESCCVRLGLAIYMVKITKHLTSPTYFSK